MKKIIYCIFFKKKLEKQDFQTYPGELGKYIYENISKKAWKIWLETQTIFINENKLNLKNIKDHKTLEKKMKNFLLKK